MTGSIAPTGVLRAVINLGNVVLARRDADGEVGGVSVDLACALGEELGVPVELVPVPRAADSVAAVREQRVDIGFFAIDPARSEGIAFTAPYVLIEGVYATRTGGLTADTVDRPGRRVVVVEGSAYDLFLSRTLQQAEVVRVRDAAAARAALTDGTVEVAGGIRQLLDGWAADDTGTVVLHERFMVIEQAMGLPADRGDAAAAQLAAFVEARKASGFVGDALARHGSGATVAPPAG